jgi:hypothetical protein
MTKGRIIFYSIFGVYQLGAFIFTLIIDSTQSTSFLFSLLKYIGSFKYITFLGVLLIATDFIWLWIENRKTKRQEEAFRHENNVLKAKVYDMQEGLKPKPEVPKAK